jgi:RHS repeat-associated protein
VDSKISYIYRSDESEKDELAFEYDAMGNRIAKHVYSDNSFTFEALVKSTYYVRDASGNVMGTYEHTPDHTLNLPTVTFTCTERPIYGSSRVDMLGSSYILRQRNVRDTNPVRNETGDVTQVVYTVATENLPEGQAVRLLGNKQYEIANHLGNVLVVVSDIKLIVQDAGTITGYEAQIISATDYSPFLAALSICDSEWLAMPTLSVLGGVRFAPVVHEHAYFAPVEGWAVLEGRTYTAESGYRYGFNGMEKDSENFEGAYDFGARILDARLGRFLSIDPIAKESPWSGTYAYAANKPIFMIDIDGLKGILYIQVLLDAEGNPVIDKKTMKAVKKDLDKTYKDLGVDLKVEMYYSNTIMTKDEFNKREGADATDSYIIVGKWTQLLNVVKDNKERGWDNVMVTTGAYGKGDPRSFNGTSTSTDQYFAVVDADNCKKIGVNENFTDVVNKISVTIQHESLHPKNRNHPGMCSYNSGEAVFVDKGTTDHVPGTIMAAEPSTTQVYDMYMVTELRKIHGTSSSANVCVEDSPLMRSTVYANFQKANPSMGADAVKAAVDKITTWVKPTYIQPKYQNSDKKKIANAKQ